jgi:hypothetical protein
MVGMKYRKLRIAWSVGWGILCLLLILLWVRSYWWRDNVKVRLPADLNILFASEDGLSGFLIRENNTGVYPIEIDSWPCNSEDIRFFPFNSDSDSPLGYAWWFGNRAFGAIAPYWFPAVLFTALTVAPWIRQWQWRFSLRTLLIGMTLVAVVLGLIVYLSAKPPAAPPLDHVDLPEF